jgi:hypothetical protein
MADLPDANGGPESEFRLVLPFWIDTVAYNDRDRAMFTAGYEFCQVVDLLENTSGPMTVCRPIHKENESRIRMAAGKLGRRVTITPCEPEHDPDGTWSYLEVERR